MQFAHNRCGRARRRKQRKPGGRFETRITRFRHRGQLGYVRRSLERCDREPAQFALVTVSVAEHCRRIKAHIAKGDRAIEKADEHYTAAGIYLKALKNEHGGSWDDWTKLLKTKVGISTGRASELMQIADGRKTVGELREADGAKHRHIRDQRSSGRPEENGTNVIPRPRVVFEAEERVIRAPATFSDAKPDGDGGPDDDDDR